MSAHTQGPWHIRESRTGISVRASESAGGAVARLAITQFSAQREEGRANARLIAAAPEMLKALKAIREWLLDAEVIKENDNRFWRSDFVKANNLAHEAIAKAEGRS